MHPDFKNTILLLDAIEVIGRWRLKDAALNLPHPVPEDFDLFNADVLAQLLGYSSFAEMPQRQPEINGLLAGLCGPNGYAIYRMLKLQRELT